LYLVVTEVTPSCTLNYNEMYTIEITAIKCGNYSDPAMLTVAEGKLFVSMLCTSSGIIDGRLLMYHLGVQILLWGEVYPTL